MRWNQITRHYPFLILILALAISGCSNSVSAPVVEPTADEVDLDIVVDVRDNLLKYYTDGAAAKAPAPPVEQRVRFDFRETARMVSGRGEAVITGEFLLAIGDQAIRRGSIAFFFTLERLAWVRTGQFEVLEEPVVSHVLDLLITDANSGAPLPGASVEAVRIDDGVRSSRVEQTGLDGRAHLEVLTGVFLIRAEHESYTTALSDFVPVIESRQEAILQLVPIKDGQPAL